MTDARYPILKRYRRSISDTDSVTEEPPSKIYDDVCSGLGVTVSQRLVITAVLNEQLFFTKLPVSVSKKNRRGKNRIRLASLEV